MIAGDDQRQAVLRGLVAINAFGEHGVDIELFGTQGRGDDDPLRFGTIDAAGSPQDVRERLSKQVQYGYMAESGENMTFIPWTLDDYTSHRVTLDSQSLAVHNDGGTQWINDAAPLITFDEDDFKEGIAERELIIKIWIEGTDREADKAFTDGQLKYNFSFVGINKESFESSNAELNAKKIVSDGQKLYYQMGETREEIVTSNLLQYSYNGIDWNSYSGLLEAEGNSSYKYVYVRYAEKLNVKASKPIYVEFTN